METIMAEPAFLLPSATATIAARSNPAAGARRAAAPARLRCRVEPAADQPPSDQSGAAPQGEEDEAIDYTGFSMVGVAG
jgi:hypothetical protein